MAKSLVSAYVKSISHIDKGWARIKKELSLADNSYVKVGLPENGEVSPGARKGSGRESFADMSELVLVGVANEFGTIRIPERSFMRSTFDEEKESINKKGEVFYRRIIDLQETAESALNKLGIWFVSKVKRKITTLNTPPNAPSTIRRKDSSNPLIDTGQMRASIQYKVFMRGLPKGMTEI